MGETPRKVVDGDLQCFLCCNDPSLKERIRISGKSSLDIRGLIKTTVDVDVNVYSGNNFFICTNPCYKRLVKLDKLEKNIEALKEDVRSNFIRHKSARVKRMRRDSDVCISYDTSDTTHATCTPTSGRPGAAKSLKFTSSACTSYSYTGVGPGLLTFQQPYQLVYNAFGNTPIELPLPVANLLTSTPVRSKQDKCRTNSKVIVKMSVEYPSKSVNKTLQPSYEALGKALVHGPPERIANAVLKCEPIVNIVIKNVLHTVLVEVNGLCSRKNPSLLRKASKEDLLNFKMESVCEEWKTRAPVFFAFLMTVALSQGTKEATWLPSVAIAGSILLKQRSSHMNATAVIIGILLKTGSLEVGTFYSSTTPGVRYAPKRASVMHIENHINVYTVYDRLQFSCRTIYIISK